MSAAEEFEEERGYVTPFDVMSEMDRARDEAERIDAKVRARHAAGVRFWPSMASLVRTTIKPDGRMSVQCVGDCMRASWYACRGVVATEGRSQRGSDSADLGSIMEKIYVERFRACPGYRVVYPSVNGTKLKFRNAFGVSGELDLVLEHVETGTLFGVEMKTYDGAWAAIDLAGVERARQCYGAACTPYVRKFLDKGRRVPNPKASNAGAPKDQNLLQVMQYLEEFWDDGIRLFKLVYAARDKGPRVDFDVSLVTDEDGERYPIVNGRLCADFPLSGIHKRWRDLRSHVESGLIPRRDYVVEVDHDRLLGDDGYAADCCESIGSPRYDTVEKIREAVRAGDVPRHWRCSYCKYLGKCLTDGEDFMDGAVL